MGDKKDVVLIVKNYLIQTVEDLSSLKATRLVLIASNFNDLSHLKTAYYSSIFLPVKGNST